MRAPRRSRVFARVLLLLSCVLGIASGPATRAREEPRIEATLERVDGMRFDTQRDAVCLYAPSEQESDASAPVPDDPASLIRLSVEGLPPGATRILVRVRTPRDVVHSAASIACDSGCPTSLLRFATPGSASIDDPAGTLRIEANLFDVVEVVFGAEDGPTGAAIHIGGPTETASRCTPLVLETRIDDVRADPDAFAPSGMLQTSVAATHALLVENANRALEGCGIQLREVEARPPHVAPPPFVLAIADGDGLPARGGEIRFRANSQPIGPVVIPSGSTALQTAERVAASLDAAGFRARVVVLPKLDRAAYRSADVLVRDARGNPATLTIDSRSPLTTDRRQRVQIGAVDFADGLDEFDADRSLAGTLEERSLLYAFLRAPAEPPLIHVLLIDRFGRGTRLGESFVPRDNGPLAGFVVIDRRGIAADTATYTLAHEVGHVLLDDPFHPPPSERDPFRVMARDSGRTDVVMARSFTREECNRMRTHGRTLLLPPQNARR